MSRFDTNHTQEGLNAGKTHRFSAVDTALLIGLALVGYGFSAIQQDSGWQGNGTLPKAPEIRQEVCSDEEMRQMPAGVPTCDDLSSPDRQSHEREPALGAFGNS